MWVRETAPKHYVHVHKQKPIKRSTLVPSHSTHFLHGGIIFPQELQSWKFLNNINKNNLWTCSFKWALEKTFDLPRYYHCTQTSHHHFKINFVLKLLKYKLMRWNWELQDKTCFALPHPKQHQTAGPAAVWRIIIYSLLPSRSKSLCQDLQAMRNCSEIEWNGINKKRNTLKWRNATILLILSAGPCGQYQH